MPDTYVPNLDVLQSRLGSIVRGLADARMELTAKDFIPICLAGRTYTVTRRPGPPNKRKGHPALVFQMLAAKHRHCARGPSHEDVMLDLLVRTRAEQLQPTTT